MELTSDKGNLTREDLVKILETYNHAAERLKESHDVLQTEVRRLREELASKNRQLERRKRLAALGEMAAGLAHEIRNPLAGIHLYANLLRRDLTDRTEQVETVDKIITGVKALDSLVTDVLALTHTVEPKFTASDMVGIIQSAIELLQPLIVERKVQIVFHSSSEMVLMCDSRMLQRAILNLLKNAIEAAGEEGRVLIDLHARNQRVILQLADSGPGIDPEIADRIFNPFFTTKDYGTGLGLSIVHRIIEAHDGSISAGRSSLGGALFTIKIPMSKGRRHND